MTLPEKRPWWGASLLSGPITTLRIRTRGGRAGHRAPARAPATTTKFQDLGSRRRGSCSLRAGGYIPSVLAISVDRVREPVDSFGHGRDLRVSSGSVQVPRPSAPCARDTSKPVGRWRPCVLSVFTLPGLLRRRGQCDVSWSVGPIRQSLNQERSGRSYSRRGNRTSTSQGMRTCSSSRSSTCPRSSTASPVACSHRTRRSG